MSDAARVTAVASGAPAAQVDCLPIQGMITLRGQPTEVAEAIRAATGCGLPEQRGIVFEGERGVAWMSPDEWLLLMPQEMVSECLATLAGELSSSHHLAVEVSDARAMFRISGTGAREALARVCPVDLSPATFAAGEIRRTRLAQVPAAFWIGADGAFRLVCFRSVARYAQDVLENAASGAPVGFFPEG
ncbi:sarcosine oxidase subunit gamma [Tropicimonas sediminicola]|uniref:Sarcosine oxidase subunit gamma n=1 Tax=Tropicimonas sediminicola TaxID=1031541 RepID=A0A239D8B3_9RHOB|nr:sarcosine oxidase subunit gamma family protein [Tropicimonas sediminicola]SNS28615.1 sarcosine oxidase subunit gamma [Tropicimonas sediminicola]